MSILNEMFAGLFKSKENPNEKSTKKSYRHFINNDRNGMRDVS